MRRISHIARATLPLAGMIALAAVVATAAAPALHAQSTVAVGDSAPDAELTRPDGTPVSLSQYIGKTPVLIEFWATWCPNCRALEPTMHRVAAKYAGRVKFLGVAVSVNESRERAKLYAEKHKLPVEVLWDGDGNASGAYDVPATSYIVIIDKNGKIVYTGVGADQDLDAAVSKALAG
ncbi:MAG TPA: TlpA disulfide reductase family protein [Gemmatimonadaceae bacterium]|nr:TlpA disulfide reductase family protein [Gemmatimonadaceae bacterium]